MLGVQIGDVRGKRTARRVVATEPNDATLRPPETPIRLGFGPITPIRTPLPKSLLKNTPKPLTNVRGSESRFVK
jgi:hypothetical protein